MKPFTHILYSHAAFSYILVVHMLYSTIVNVGTEVGASGFNQRPFKDRPAALSALCLS
jgi:hypothetical protein